ncbi:MAG: hypothetical protein QF786_00175 [Vicinamibacterales bacterium]|jgi:hypothetical protein|nr:hypothetical protein [Vicinamibacterales bacterium]
MSTAPIDELINDTDAHKTRTDRPYAEYPRHMHSAGGGTRIVNSDEEREQALDVGYTLQPGGEPRKKKPAPAAEAALEKPKRAKAKGAATKE